MSILADGWSLVNSAGEVISEALGLGDGDDSDGAMGSLRYILVEGDPLVGETGIILPVGRSSPELTGIPVAFIGDMVQCYTCGQIKPIEKDGGPYRVGIFSGDVDISVFDIVNATEEFAYENDVIYCACGKKPLQAVLAPVQQAKDIEDAPSVFTSAVNQAAEMFKNGWRMVSQEAIDVVNWAVEKEFGKPLFSLSSAVKQNLIDQDIINSGVGDRIKYEASTSYSFPAQQEGYINIETTVNTDDSFDSIKFEFKPTGTSTSFDSEARVVIGQEIGNREYHAGVGLGVGLGEVTGGYGEKNGNETTESDVSVRAGAVTAGVVVLAVVAPEIVIVGGTLGGGVTAANAEEPGLGD